VQFGWVYMKNEAQENNRRWLNLHIGSYGSRRKHWALLNIYIFEDRYLQEKLINAIDCGIFISRIY